LNDKSRKQFDGNATIGDNHLMRGKFLNQQNSNKEFKMKRTIIGTALVTFLLIGSVSYGSENDLPLSDTIKILKVTPLGANAKEIFEIELKTITYESMKSAVIEKIKNGYKPDCECDFDNDYFIQLENRPILYGTERDNSPVIRFPGTSKKDGDPLTRIRFECRVIMSENKKFAGLIFRQIINDGLMHQHFMLVNSKGEILWEMPHEMRETLADNLLKRIKFPEDEKAKTYDFCQVSNDGKLVFLRGSFLRGEKGWMLYGSDGQLIKENSKFSLYPVLSDDGDYLLVQENNQSDGTDFYDDSGTSCYDADTGKLLWRKRDVLPIHGPGYFISPSGKKIVACLKTSVFSPCFLDSEGNILAVSSDPDSKRCRSEDFFPGWNSKENLFFWHKSSFDSNFRLTKKQLFFPKEYKQCAIYSTNSLNEQYLLSFGTCFIDQSYKMPAKETKKFICIRDKNMKICGLIFIETPELADQNIRVEIDQKCGTVYFRTNDALISAKIEIPGEAK
jgi:hypothetical protein